MALDFPASPVVNDVYTFGDKSWIWTGTTWDPAPGGYAHNITVSTSAPSGGSSGDIHIQYS